MAILFLMGNFPSKKTEYPPESDGYFQFDGLNMEKSAINLLLKMFYKSLLLRIDLISCQKDVP